MRYGLEARGSLLGSQYSLMGMWLCQDQNRTTLNDLTMVGDIRRADARVGNHWPQKVSKS